MASFYSVPGHSSAATIRPGGPLQEFWDLLISCTRKSVIHEPHRDFILVNRMLTWFRSEYKHSPGSTNAGRVLTAVYDAADKEPVNLIVNLLQAMTEADDRCWLKIFIILLRMKRGTYIEHFWNNRVLDRRLPISKGDMLKIVSKMPLPDSEDKSQFTREFFNLQYELCTKDSLDGRKLEDAIILPICKMEPIRPIAPEDEGLGKEVKVFLIEVPCDSISPNILRNIKSKPFPRAEDDEEEYHEFALKVLKDHKEYERESFAYNALRGSDGIVQCLSNWEIQKQTGESEYHLLLEYGSYDLDDYFENFAPPSLPREIIKFWDQLSDVAVALDKIHNLQHTVEFHRTTEYYGWHGDIKPENLVFCEGRWKIADPGFARIEAKRTATLMAGYPVVKLEGGTKYYGPPEQAFDDEQPVTQFFDIWSLGCVLSETATWLLLGDRGVEQFRMVRKLMESGDREISLTKIEGDDCFHNGTNISQGVLDWHNYLRNSLREHDWITGAILNLIERHMLIEKATLRINSKDLVHHLREIINTAKKDKSLGPYAQPPYFKVAFKAEQRKIATELSKPSGQSRRSNRHKSTRLQTSSGSVIMGLEGNVFERSHIYPPLLETEYPEGTQLGERGQYGSYYKIAQDNLTTATPGLVLSVSDYSNKAAAKKEVMEKFDYWDALHLLESQGWVYRGTLERPGEARAHPAQPVDSIQAVISPPPSLKSLDPHPAPQDKEKVKKVMQTVQRRAYRNSPPVVQHRSLSQSDIVQKFWRRNSKETLSVFQKDLTILTQPTSPPITASTQLSGIMEIDANLKNTKIEDYFVERDILFLLDNGSTMGKHWPRARELIAALVTLLHGQDDNGMEIYFTSSERKFGPIAEPYQFVNIINRMRPESEPGQSHHLSEAAKRANDIRKTLSLILGLVGKPDYKRKLTLIILTDGIWSGISEKRTVADKIVTCYQEWQDEDSLKKMLDDRGLSLQFVQFGDDEEATKEFDYMDNHLAKPNGERLPNIIDVEPATGNVWKMILGSLSMLTNSGAPETVTSDGSRSHVGRPGSVAASSPHPMYPQRRSTELVEEPATYTPGHKHSTSASATDHYGAQFTETMSPKHGESSSRQVKDSGGPSSRRRGTKESGSTVYHTHSRSG